MLRITRRFAAPREKVFQAWTDPHALMRWFAPSDDYSTLLAEVDLRVSGSYRIGMKALDEASSPVKGGSQEMTPPERLVFAWTWAGTGLSWRGLTEFYEPLVTIALRTVPEGTDLTLTHKFSQPEKRETHHRSGWMGCPARLSKVL